MKDYRCSCGWAGHELLMHPRQGFGVCPRCWHNGTERIPVRIFKVMLSHKILKLDRHAPAWLPWSTVEGWRSQIEQNHDQTPERLHERGLSPAELWCAAHGRGVDAIIFYREIDDERALPWLYQVYGGNNYRGESES